jgi:hypothetical protein
MVFLLSQGLPSSGIVHQRSFSAMDVTSLKAKLAQYPEGQCSVNISGSLTVCLHCAPQKLKPKAGDCLTKAEPANQENDILGRRLIVITFMSARKRPAGQC